MSYSNSTEINIVDGGDEDRGNDFGFGQWIFDRNSISSRMSQSSPRDSSGSPSSSANGYFDFKKTKVSKRKAWYLNRTTIGLGILVGLFFLMNFWMLRRIQEPGRVRGNIKLKPLKSNATTVFIREELQKLGRGEKPQKTIYARLLAKAAHALAEGETKEPKDLWMEPYTRASSWIPCSQTRNWEPSGCKWFYNVTANGGINQQPSSCRYAMPLLLLECLMQTLCFFRGFMFSSVWRYASQFSDIYQEDYFIDYLKPDIRVVKELPLELQSLDLEAMGSMVTDSDITKEAKPSFYMKYILPILHLNRVVHFVGFGNRLASDPVPHKLQLILYVNLVEVKRKNVNWRLTEEYISLHWWNWKKRESNRGFYGIKGEIVIWLCIELYPSPCLKHGSFLTILGSDFMVIDMSLFSDSWIVAVSSPTELKSEGLCPLMPEETVLMLAGLGFNRRTHIYLAGAHIYGGNSRLSALTTLFPNLVTKENLLSSTEIDPFRDFSSRLAALDFIACTAADVFAMTDSGSQFSSLVAGYRIYYGGGKMATIRPNKRRLADIFINDDFCYTVVRNRLLAGPVRYSLSEQLKSLRAFVTASLNSKICVASGAKLNQSGFTLTITPLGGSTVCSANSVSLLISIRKSAQKSKKIRVQGPRPSRINKASPKTKQGSWVYRVGSKTLSHYRITVVVMLGSRGAKSAT
ncbi:hypothetical protein SASPL_121407 [Salvia splendens]|uniref:O-fucosyltransferase family protein n=1 Tax=Salvia splendens TaxID=180675 RepID=A0A8X8XWE2_SALSN|nr:hypothetical protein SASPL_121407 [Salvia splendens]